MILFGYVLTSVKWICLNVMYLQLLKLFQPMAVIELKDITFTQVMPWCDALMVDDICR